VLCGKYPHESAMRVEGEAKEEGEACWWAGWGRNPALGRAGWRSEGDEVRAGRRRGVVAVQSTAVEGEPPAKPE